MTGYSALDRLFHGLVLGVPPVARTLLESERRRLTDADRTAAGAGRHVFIAGLARSGTTALLNRFHGTEAFRSLTYRDMPMVLAPGLWRSLGGARGAARYAGERAHGDGIRIDTDSPEALEEAFWRVHAGAQYILSDRLVPHRPDAALRDLFRDYVSVILRSGETGRYLSKNNNAILRLDAIAETFPNATILVPYRDPLAQAASLLRQHRRFAARGAAEPFTRRYMGWLAHHEFGADHRPFDFGTMPSGDPMALVYWLRVWIATYGWLRQNAPSAARFVCYEDLCAGPAAWHAIARSVDLTPDVPDADGFRSPRQRPHGVCDAPAALVAEARALYLSLREDARAAA